MALTEWLIDTSALYRLGRSPTAALWASRLERGLIRISTVTRLEVGFSARAARELRSSKDRPPLSRMPIEYLTPWAEQRAMAVQELLADRGQHRAASVPDLLLAAIAEHRGLTVLHADKDFELIAEVTGQPTERLR